MRRSAVAVLLRHATDALDPDEDFVAGIQLQRAGYSNSAGAAAVGGMIGAAIRGASQRDRLVDHEVTLQGVGYLAVTSKRVLVFKGLAFRPAGLLAEVSRCDATLGVEPFRTLGLPRARVAKYAPRVRGRVIASF